MNRKQFTLLILLILTSNQLNAQQNLEEQNKRIALKFYHDLWVNPTTDKYAETVADTYVVHDIGDRKGVVEPAIEQKHIADFFWENGTPDFELDYQIADGDLVATRWTVHFVPETLFGKVVLTEHSIPIINVFRIKDGKIVEIWNHRHDIDTTQTTPFFMKGLALGLVVALIPLFILFRTKRKLKTITS